MCQGPEAGRSWLCKELKEEGHSGGMEAAGRRSVGSGGGGLGGRAVCGHLRRGLGSQCSRRSVQRGRQVSDVPHLVLSSHLDLCGEVESKARNSCRRRLVSS